MKAWREESDAVEAYVFLKSKKKSQEGKTEMACFIHLALVKELQLKLSKVAGTMNIVTNCVNF